jgi:phosphoribosylformylglycinamidine (FGAM) synthase-like amidotransferase family enzyme
MPHPERACQPVLGSDDGLAVFKSVVTALAGRGSMPLTSS